MISDRGGSPCLWGILMLVTGVAWAQNAALQRPQVRAGHLETLPDLDGEVLADPAWTAVTPATGFIQNTPFEGRGASERTEVYVGYSEDTLYIGVMCFDREPERIIVASSRRDSSLEEEDSFQLILDTYLDQQTGFVFGTNPAGIEYDGQVTREGQGGGFISAGGFNKNWDGIWQVKSKVSPAGWSAELAIPFRTLRFPRQPTQTWGVNFQRNIRRHNENSFWSPLPRQFNLYRLSMAGQLTDLAVPRQRNLKITPYVKAETEKSDAPEAERQDDQEIGLDAKFSITPSLTLDATINTDFAQVEVDELQINLDRFNLFFPEKRPFFLENAGYFAVGVPQEIELFYSRRIGLGKDGEVIPIDGGLRLSGKAGHYNLGMLYMQTDEELGVAPENKFSVARVSRDLPNRSSFGGIVINRKASGQVLSDEDDNWTYGLDGRWGLGESGLIDGFVAQTDTPGLTGDDHAFRLGGRYDSEAWSLSANYTEVGDDFNPEVGFLTRKGYRKPDFFVLRRIRPQDLWGLQELRPHVSYRGFWDFEDFQETGFLHLDNHWEWRRGHEVHTGVNFTTEGVKEAFEIVDGVVVGEGTYDHTELQLVSFTNRGAPVSVGLRVVAGGFFGGDRMQLTPDLRFRIGEAFNTEVNWSHNDIDLPGGTFKTNLGRLRVSYSFTPRIFVQGLIQYNDLDGIWASNLRFAWLHDASTGFYIVYNDIQDIGSANTGLPGRSLTIKYSRVFDLLR